LNIQHPQLRGQAMATRRSKRKSTVNIVRASDEDKRRIRERRITKLESDADDVVADGDDDDEDFQARPAPFFACVLVKPAQATHISWHYHQGSGSDAEVSNKKRATKRRSNRRAGQQKQAANLSKNFAEVSSSATDTTTTD